MELHLKLVAVLMLLLVSESRNVIADDAAPIRKGVSFRLAEVVQADGLVEAIDPDREKRIYLHKNELLTEKDVKSVCFSDDKNGRIGLTLHFDADAENRIRAATKAHIGKPIAILLDGKVISAPEIVHEISGSARIIGAFSDADLLRMFSVLVLRSEGPDQGDQNQDEE